ncbi:MAG: glutathione synthetase [Bacteroidales bacterium]|jgi:MtN3 and saliva related transmembrane protein|nr:glutathione synthetase [Bacteroidales bacterium]OPZ98827.1 MAG: PQ loop repeat protein [Bacteroidetes bacterium ADurb.Bin416]
MTLISVIGVLAAIASTLNQLPQAYKTIRSKDTHSLSLGMYSLVWAATALWLIYGILIKDVPLILSNSISILPITYILSMKVYNTATGKDATIDALLKKEKLMP